MPLEGNGLNSPPGRFKVYDLKIGRRVLCRHRVRRVRRNSRQMNAVWPVARCILCLAEGELSVEHLIPRALGGTLTSSFLCRICNSQLGSDVEASAKSDPSILLAVRKLHDDLPKQFQWLIESHPQVATGEGPRVSGYVRDGAFRAKPQIRDDDSLILPTDEARRAITTTLKRSHYGEVPIKRALEMFERMPENRKTTIVPGLDIVKWRIDRLDLDFSHSRLVDPLLPAKIAFEFLALCGGTAIYPQERQLSDVRQILKTGKGWDDTSLRVQRLTAGDARPFHGICNEENPEHSQIQIRLFGSLAYRVRFPRLYVEGPRYAYTQRLDTGEEDLRMVGGQPWPRRAVRDSQHLHAANEARTSR